MPARKPKHLRVLTEPDPFLRQTVSAVANPSDPQVKQLIQDMAFTMKKENGIGLAAIQVGVNARVVVIETKDGILGLVNPEITWRSDETELGEEGCLSVPGEYAPVRRSTSVHVDSFDEDGNEQTHEAHGLLARVVQHEIDHLNGILFIDKIESFSREELPELRQAM